MSAALAAWLVLATAIVVLGFALAGLYRAVAVLSQRVMPDGEAPGPNVGARLPEQFVGDVGAGTIALFVDDSCHACRSLIAALSTGDVPVDSSRLNLVFRGDRYGVAESEVRITEHADAAFVALGVSVTPTAIRIGPDGKIEAVALIGNVAALTEFAAHRPVAGKEVAANGN